MAGISYNGKTADSIEIEHEQFGIETWTAASMAELAGETFPLNERVPEAAGLAFDWMNWFNEWLLLLKHTSQCRLEQGTHLKLYAADSFEAVIPWTQLRQAAVQFAEEDGSPLAAGGPIRFYVPNGSSKCLNVKNVVRIVVSSDSAIGETASYGFKQQFSAKELFIKKRSTS